MNRFSPLIIAGCLSMAINANAQGGGSPRQVIEASTANAGNHSYLVLRPTAHAQIDYTVSRSSADDPDVCLAVAASFTGEDLVSVLGNHVVDGTLLPGYADSTATGHALLVNGTVKIMPQSQLGHSIATAVAQGGSLLQQCLIVENGVPHPERVPEAIRARRAHIIYRALIVDHQGQWAIVQNAEPTYPEEFVADLAAIGAQQALYLDMGSWAYGWWRTAPGAERHELAEHFANTSHQSNWLFVKLKVES